MVCGSCFAERVGQWLTDYRFQVNQNSHGIIFHPLALARSVQRAVDATPYTEADLNFHQGLYSSFDHHGSFNADNAEDALRKMNDRLMRASEFFRCADVMVITFGSAWAYEHAASQRIVANCHKMPQSDFRKILIDHSRITDEWKSTMEAIRKVNPQMRFVFSVSPVRYLRDGAHGNQLSKAHLLLAAEALTADDENASYFPAYELVLDELRDYRFYAEDMLHPSAQAVDYILEKFRQMYLSEDCIRAIHRMEPLVKFLQHRPLHVTEDAWAIATSEKRSQLDALLNYGA